MERVAEIESSPAAVWAVMQKVEAWPERTPSMTEVRALDGGGPRPRARFRLKQPRMPAVVGTVTQVDPERSFTWEVRSPGAHTVGEHRLAGERPTALTLRVAQHGWLARLLRPLLAGRMRRYVEMEAPGLKRRCEELEGATPGDGEGASP